MKKFSDFIKKIRVDKNLLYIILAVLIFIIYKIYVWSNTESTDNAYVDSDISTVSSQISGNISEVLCIDNQQVKAGEVLAKIEDTKYKAALEVAISKTKNGEFALSSIEQKIALENDNLIKVQQLVDFAKTNLDLAMIDYKRNVSLHNEKYNSQKVLDESKSLLEKAKFDFGQANIALSMSKKNLEILEIQKFITQQDLEALKQLEISAKEDLKNTVIVSPIEGVIASNGIRLGNFVRQGTPLVAVVPSKSYIRANFKETQIVHMHPEQEVKFTVDAIKGRKFYGKIRGIYPATGSKFSLIPADNATGNFTKIVQRIPVIIDFDYTQEGVNMIRTGMSVDVHVRY